MPLQDGFGQSWWTGDMSIPGRLFTIFLWVTRFCCQDFELWYDDHCVALILPSWVPAGSPSRGGDLVVYAFDINQPSLLTPFYFALVIVSISVSTALSTVFYSMNSSDNSPLSHSVLLVLFLSYWSVQLYISLWQSRLALIYSFVVDWAYSTN